MEAKQIIYHFSKKHSSKLYKEQNKFNGENEMKNIQCMVYEIL